MIEQKLEYDRASTIFSPEGLLYQVQYAMEAVNKGGTVIGIVFKNGVLLVADKKQPDGLMESDFIEKIFIIDDHIAIALAGLVGDGRRLIYDAEVDAQRNKFVFDEKVDIIEIVNRMCEIKQAFTQFGGLRPFGVSLLIAGIDSTGPRLFETDPSGTPTEWKATAIGLGRNEVIQFLQENYKDDMELTVVIALAVESLRLIRGNDLDNDVLEMVAICKDSEDNIKAHRYTREEIISYLR